MDTFKGMFLLKKDKNVTIRAIKELCDCYSGRQANNIKEEKSLYHDYFHDVNECLRECFYETFGSIRRCLAFAYGAQHTDDICYQRVALYRVFCFLMELYRTVPDAISINDFPSCKDLLQLSEEDLVSVANDLVGNKVVKSKVSFVLLGKGVDNLIKIGDVMAFYDNMANEMQADINEKGLSDISLESFLLKKAKAEYAYCFLAMLKVGHSIGKEAKTIKENLTDDESNNTDMNNMIFITQSKNKTFSSNNILYKI